MVKFALDARKVIVIMINAFWRGEIFLLHIDGGIADAIAFGPLLVTLDAGEGAGQDGAAGTAVVVWFDVAVGYYC